MAEIGRIWLNLGLERLGVDGGCVKAYVFGLFEATDQKNVFLDKSKIRRLTSTFFPDNDKQAQQGNRPVFRVTSTHMET